MIFLILVYAFSQSFGSCEILRVNIPFCTVSFDKPLLLDQMCLGLANDKIIGNILGNETIEVSEYTSMSIFTKLQQEVYGMGMECSKYKTKWLFEKTFFGEYHQSSETTYVRLSRSECFEMKSKKICATKEYGDILKLECNGDVCSTEEKVFEPLFYTVGWWGKSSSETYSCQINPRLITAVNENDHIFGTNCVPTDLYCNLPRSIIVWEESILMKCPFRPLKLNVLMAYIMISSNEEMFIVQNDMMRWAFKSNEPVTECGMVLIKTTEGLYLAPEKDQFEKVASAKIGSTLYDDKSEMGIKLASDDFNIIEEKKIENDLLVKECKLLQNMIQLFSLEQDKFFKFTDLKNSELILYARNSQVFKPSCLEINQIMINEKSFKCYEDFPIEFNYTAPDGKTTTKINGFLSVNEIIKSVGKEIACNGQTTYMNIANSNISLQKIDNLYKVLYNLNYQQLNVHLNKYEPLLDHNELLVNGVDYLKQIEGMNKVVEINGLYSVIQPIIPFIDKKDHFNLADRVGKIVFYGLVIFLFLFAIFIQYKFINFLIYLKKRSKKNTQYNDLRKCVEFVKRSEETSGTKTDSVPWV